MLFCLSGLQAITFASPIPRSFLSIAFTSKLRLVSPALPGSGEGKENELIFAVAYIGSGGAGALAEG